MWEQRFTEENWNKINQRVLEFKALIPKDNNDTDISYACRKILKGLQFMHQYFKIMLPFFYSLTLMKNPPEHTVVIEADIGHVSKWKPNQKKAKDE